MNTPGVTLIPTASPSATPRVRASGGRVKSQSTSASTSRLICP